MAEYTAASAAIKLFPKIKTGFNREVESKLSGIESGVKIKPALDQPALAKVKADLVKIGNPTVKVDADISALQKEKDKAVAELDKLKAKKTDPKITADISALEKAKTRAVAALDQLKAKKTDPKVDLDIAEMQAKLAQANVRLDALKAKTSTPKVDADIAVAEAKAAKISAALDELQAKRADPKIDADIAAGEAKIVEITAKLDELAAKKADPQVDADIAAAEAKLTAMNARLDQLSARRAEIQANADTAGATAKLSALDSFAAAISGRSVNVNANADTGAAVAGLLAVDVAIGLLDGKNPVVRVVADTAGAVAGLALTTAKVLALVGALGALAGAGGGAIGVLGGLGAAGAVAAGGLGASILAFRGVGKALQAMSAQQDSAGTDAQASAQKQAAAAQQVEAAQRRVAQTSAAAAQARSDAARNVARAEADSAKEITRAQADMARQVASARQSAARAIASAENQAAAAARTLKAATADLAREQKNLTAAWEAGRRSLQDLQDQVDGNALDQRQAAFDLADAKQALAEAQASGDTDKIARAQLAYDRQLETIDQLNKQTQRLGVDNAKAQAAGVAGSNEVVTANQRIADAQTRVADATRSAGQANAAVNQARMDGAAAVALAEQQGAQRIADAQEAASRRVSDAREQGARSIASADQAAADAQIALRQALAQTADSGSAAGKKVAQAFANLSPAAAAFARYLFGLKPLLEELSATAASKFFPPLMAGMDALVAKFPQINTIVGQLAAGMGAGLQLVLTQLASPFWMGFFAMLGNAAGTVIPALFQTLMNLAGALAILITNLMPVIPAALGALNVFAQWIAILSPFIAQAFGGLIPAFTALLQGLLPLGPVLAALTPILVAITQAFSTVLGAVLQALAPVLVALTPLIQQLALAFAQQLVGAIQSLTPFLVGVANWMSQHPQLVLGVVSAVGLLTGAFGPLMTALGLVAKLVLFAQLRSLAAGMSGAGAAAAGSASKVGLLGRMFSFLTGPIGIVLTIFGLLFASNQQFRDAVMGVLGVLGQLVGVLVQALMPVFQALMGVVNMIMGVFGMLLQQLAAALVPVLNMLAGVLMQLAMALLPPLVGLFTQLAPVIGLLGQILVSLLTAFSPIIGMFAQLIMTLLPPLVSLLTSVVIPVIQFLADVLGKVLGFVIQYVLLPVLQALVWWIQNVTVPVFQWMASMIGPIFQGIGDFFNWVWTTLIKPVFDFFVAVFHAVADAINWFWVSIVQPVLNAVGAFFGWVWTYLIKPPLDLLVWFFQKVLGPLFQWFMYLVVDPIMRAVGAVIGWVWNNLIKPVIDGWINIWNNYLFPAIRALYDNVIKPVMDAVGAAIQWVYDHIVKPVMDGFANAFNGTGSVVETVRDVVIGAWNKLGDVIRAVYDNTLKPIFDAVKGGFEAIKGAVDWVTGSDPVPPPPGRVNGGLVVPVGYASGGWVSGGPSLPSPTISGWTGFANGGASNRRPKPGPTDTVPTLLTPGEFVMTRGATAAAGSKVMYDLMALLERDPAAAKVLGQVVGTLSRGGSPSTRGGDGASSPAGFALGGMVGARRPELDIATPAPTAVAAAVPSSSVTVDADASAALTAAGQTSALAGSMNAATLAAQALNPVLAGLAATQQGLLVPAQAAVTLGQQVMAATVTDVLTPAMGLYQAELGVNAPLANQALQGAQLATQVSTTATAVNTQLNTAAMTAATQGMSLATQVEHGAIRNTQLLTRLDTNATLLNTQLNNTGMTLSTQQRSIAAQFENGMIRTAQLLTRQDTDATSANNTLRNNEMMASTGLMSATNQNHLLNLRNGQGVTTQATTAFADAFRAQMARTQPDSGNPIKWVINYPIRSITDAWNSLDAQFALGKHVNPYVPNFAVGGVFAGSGKVHGPGGSTSDNVNARLSPGEFVVRAGIAQSHIPFLQALNSGQAEAREAAGGRRANPPGYAAGGEIPVERAKAYARAQAGKPYVWGGVGPGGFDCSGLWSAIVNTARGQAPNRRLGTAASNPWPGFVRGLSSALAVGANSGHMAGTIGGMNAEARTTGKPVYAGPPAVGADNGQFTVKASLPQIGGQFVSGGAGGGAGIDVGAVVNAAFAKTYREIADVPKYFGPSAQVGRDQGTARFAADKVRDVATAKLSEMFAAMGNGPMGTGEVRAQVMDAAKPYGWNVGPQWAAIDWLLSHESSWNPLAKNPSSTAFGLFQFLDSTWASVGGTKTSNAHQQAVLGFRYIKNRYRDPLGAKAFWSSHHWYDQGGLAYGKGLMLKGTDEAERVLSPIETRNYEVLGRLLGPSGTVRVDGINDGGTGEGAAPLVGTVENHYHREQGSEQATKDLVHTLRVVRKGG